MRIGLCDDNWVQLSILHDKARECEHWRDMPLDIDEFASGTELLNAVRTGKEYEFILLDIEMPGLSGFDTYAELCELCDSSVIFVSSHIELLPETFALRAYGFLAKPYDQDTFDRTIKSVVDQRIETQLFHYFHGGRKETIPCKNISLFIIRDYTLTMYCTSGSHIILSRKTLNEVEYELSDSGFFRCNRSTLVNLRYCSGRKDNRLNIKQFNDFNESIEISRRELKEFDKQLILWRMGDRNAF